MITTTKVL